MATARTLTVLAVGSSLLLGCGEPMRGPEGSALRIVAVAPSIVEILYELGQGDDLVGVGDHCEWPPEVATKPRVGGLLDPRLERIAVLEPDLAILLPSEQALAGSLASLGIEVLIAPAETIEDIEVAITTIAERTGAGTAGERMLEELRRSLTPKPVAEGLEVLLVVGRQAGRLTEIYAAAEGTFLNDLVSRLGAVNVLADSRLRYPRVGLEEIVARSPKVVVELQPQILGEKARQELVADWRRDMPGPVPCVMVVEGSHVLLPGPRLGMLYRQLGEALVACGEVG
ncbi:MAG: helical backbone metal receptor [Acidobacteriota bacterium]|nr:helical backbone metal receptor [Acidobacteriota bacterium]